MHHAVKTYWESGGTAPRILNLGTGWRWVVSFAPRQIYPRHPLDRSLGGPQNRSGRGREEKKSPRNWIPVAQPIAYSLY
jgi:hypothetical protein